jgi:hypothetical protein
VGLASACYFAFAYQDASIKLSEIAIGIGPFVIEPAVSRKIGKTAMTQLTLQPNTWYHIALVRDASNNETVWIDGVRSTSGVQTDNRNYYSTAVGINWAHCTWCVAGNSVFNGERITNLRVLVGTALYNTASTTITVPSLPLTAIANTVLLLLTNSAGTLTVDTSGNQTITNTGATFITGR